MIELELRNDVYRRPLVTALDRLGLREGWKCADVGAGGGTLQQAFITSFFRNGFNSLVTLPPIANVKTLGTTGHVQEFNGVVSGKEPDLLSGKLARDALVLCHKECESVLTGRAVNIA